MNFPSIYASSPKSCENYGLFEPQVKQFLEESEEVAQNILRPTTRHERPIVIESRPRVSLISYSFGYPIWGGNYSLFSVNNYNLAPTYYRRGGSDDTAARVLIGIVGTVLAGVGAYLLGEVLSARSKIDAQVKEIKLFNGFISKEYYNDPKHPHINAIKSIVDIQDNIFERIKAQSNRQVALLVSAIAAGSMLAIGAIAASNPLMLFGACLGFGTFVGALYHHSFSVGTKPTAREATLILHWLDTLKKANEPCPTVSVDPSRTVYRNDFCKEAKDFSCDQTDSPSYTDEVPVYASNTSFTSNERTANEFVYV